MIKASPSFGFYGRDKEFEKLVRSICLRSAPTIALYGRRLIGKTELLVRAIDHIRALPSAESKPIVYLEVQPNPTQIGEELNEAIKEAGLDSLMHNIKRSLTWDPNDTERFFFDQARHFVSQGGILCLDEFHNIDIKGSQLIYYIKRIADVIRSSTLNPHPSGGGIVASGSHQQNMLRLLGDSREPLYGRFTGDIRLNQLKSPALLAMASEQGWLRDPRQFLTLYSVYGGVPGLWKKYYDEQEHNLNLRFDNFSSWRNRFWQYESLRPLENERDQWDYRAWVVTNPIAERILDKISQKPNGTLRSTLLNLPEPPQTAESSYPWSRSIKGNLVMLENHLQIIRGIRLYRSDIKEPSKYCFIDNDTRHQLMVKRIGLTTEEILDAESENYTKVLNKTSKNEGYDLERITAEYFGALHQVENGKLIHGTHYNVQLADDGPEIDALISLPESINDQERGFFLGSCKRDPKKHIEKSVSPEKVFGPFLTRLYGDRGQNRPSEIRTFLVAPHFSEVEHRTLQERGFETADLRTMARTLGYEPDQNFSEPVAEP